MKKEMLPKVNFILPTIEEEVDTIFHFCHDKSSGGWDWSDKVYKHHPELKEMVEGVEDDKKFYDQCYKYVSAYLNDNQDVIKEVRGNIQQAWEKIELELFEELVKDFEVSFPEDLKEIKASVSINPICPRYLDRWSFNVFYKSPEDGMKQTAIHEIIHFLYFKKWLEVFPGYDKKTFNGPHPEWKLSEILVIPIINNNQTIQTLINGRKATGYKEFQEIKIGQKTLFEYFGDIYELHEKGEISFGDFLKKSWEEYKNNKIQ